MEMADTSFNNSMFNSMFDELKGCPEKLLRKRALREGSGAGLGLG